MSGFIERPVNARSLSRRRLVCGVGINDADYLIQTMVDGKRSICPFYQSWARMLERSCSLKHKESHPSYIGCSVTSEWLVFSNFKAWMEGQDWKGKELDKDILHQGNKIYSPETCVFVSDKINKLLNIFRASNRVLPIGVTLCKSTLRFVAECSSNNKSKRLGTFDTPEEASEVYKAFKYNLIAEVAAAQDEPLKSALLRFVI